MQDRKVTILDIAERACVSPATVSRVINKSVAVNESKRKLVLDAMNELDYRPNVLARGLVSGRSMSVGVVTQDIGSPLYDNIAVGVVRGLKTSGYSAILADGLWRENKEAEVVNNLLGRQIDGLVVIGGYLREEEFLKVQRRIPVIQIGRELKACTEFCVSIDNFSAAYEATKYLIDLGHRRIAHVIGRSENEDAQQRYRGYREALRQSGIELIPDLVYQGDFFPQSGVLAVSAFVERGESFSAVFAGNDLMAMGVCRALHQRSIRCPDDVSVIGFDDQMETAYFVPSLTTMRQPTVEMGLAASAALLDLIAGKPHKIPVMNASLQRRESTQRPSQGAQFLQM
jgi:LacI family transcriptional regulator